MIQIACAIIGFLIGAEIEKNTKKEKISLTPGTESEISKTQANNEPEIPAPITPENPALIEKESKE